MSCAAPGCVNPLPPRGAGRPAIYCSPACRPSKQAPQHQLRVEVNHPEASPDGRAPERVWIVRLRRGNQAVVIADCLGWPSATALARQLEDLIHVPARKEPVTN